MQLYLSVTADHRRRSSLWPHDFAHVAYRIGPQSRLLRQTLLSDTHGGLLSLSDRSAPVISCPEQLCRDIFRECCQRSYSGVLADFEERLTADRLAFLRRLQTVLEKNRRRLYLPETIARHIPRSTAVICTALSGGNLRRRLEEAAAFFGAERTALDLQRLMMDFSLPCPGGMGSPLKREQLGALIEKHSPMSFYSADLSAKYFTYCENNSHHFVLYDDAHTLREKIRLGQSMDFCAAFLMYPEVEDLLEQLSAK